MAAVCRACSCATVLLRASCTYRGQTVDRHVKLLRHDMTSNASSAQYAQPFGGWGWARNIGAGLLVCCGIAAQPLAYTAFTFQASQVSATMPYTLPNKAAKVGRVQCTLACHGPCPAKQRNWAAMRDPQAGHQFGLMVRVWRLGILPDVCNIQGWNVM